MFRLGNIVMNDISSYSQFPPTLKVGRELHSDKGHWMSFLKFYLLCTLRERETRQIELGDGVEREGRGGNNLEYIIFLDNQGSKDS